MTGDGERNARRGLGALLAKVPARRVIVVGVAGGLSADLDVASVLIGERVVDDADGSLEVADAALADLAAKACGAQRGVVVTTGRIADTVGEKRRLLAVAAARTADGGAPSELSAVVDLESAAFAAGVGRVGLPWLVLRAVSDTFAEAVPALLNRSRDEGGAVRRGRVVFGLLTNPLALRPLLALRERVRTCAEELALAVERTVEAVAEADVVAGPALNSPFTLENNVASRDA